MKKHLLIIILFFNHSASLILNAQTIPDSVSADELNLTRQHQFYDSLKYKASQRKLTRLVYDFLISPPRPYVDKKKLALNYYSQLEGKIISEIRIIPLEVFGPTFRDTTKKATTNMTK